MALIAGRLNFLKKQGDWKSDLPYIHTLFIIERRQGIAIAEKKEDGKKESISVLFTSFICIFIFVSVRCDRV